MMKLAAGRYRRARKGARELFLLLALEDGSDGASTSRPCQSAETLLNHVKVCAERGVGDIICFHGLLRGVSPKLAKVGVIAVTAVWCVCTEFRALKARPTLAA
jgi:uncharacterized protein YkvS